MYRPLTLSLLLLAAISPASALAQSDQLKPSGTFSARGSKAAATPPMGWNPWNAFRTEIDEGKVFASAEKIRQSGLAAAGYRYINLDDGWWLRRGPDGRIVIRTAIFPSAATGADGRTSFKPLTDRLHAMGFKAGIYTDSGKNSCSQRHDPQSPNLPEGSLLEREIGLDGFEHQDLRVFFHDWGFDYVKVDACGLADFGNDNPTVVSGQYAEFKPEFTRAQPAQSDLPSVETRYARIGRILQELKPEGDAVLAICVWGEADSRRWAGKHGNLWRTSADIEPKWESMLHNFDSASRREMYAGPGRWNDPDMMAIGLGEFDGKHLVEARTHFSLWSILSAPLLMGFDLTRAPQPILDILLNGEVIAVNQDVAGNQGALVFEKGDVQVLVKTLANRGERAVAVFNRGAGQSNIAVTWEQLKLSAGSTAKVRDLWTHADLPAARDGLQVHVGPRETRLFKIIGESSAGEGYFLSELTGRINVAADGVTVVNPDVAAASGGPRVDRTPQGDRISLAGQKQAYGVGIQANSRMEFLAKKQFSRFTAKAGVDDSTADASEGVVFRVYGDGKLLFGSSPLHRGASPADIDLDITGVEVLELVAEGLKAPRRP
ncbi:MAG TPA: NPCBM/NEW2 domain-containing protein, partial [Pseudoxanthomonas sp.]|nr:NPCBM/NEW2 domain-containing protein [Pseudoxanthomonas sp.]